MPVPLAATTPCSSELDGCSAKHQTYLVRTLSSTPVPLEATTRLLARLGWAALTRWSHLQSRRHECCSHAAMRCPRRGC